MQVLTVNQNEAGQRFDKLLVKYLNKAPKSFIYKMLRKKNITLNGKKATGSEILNLEDEIKLFLSEETIEKFSELQIQEVKHNLQILYENKDVLIINKPAGTLSQKANPEDVSLVEEIISYMLDSKQLSREDLKSFKPSICNRLDRNTSGIVVAGKSLYGLQSMAKLFQDRSIQKYYLCIVKGCVREKQRIEGYLYKNEATNQVTIFQEQKEDAVYICTEYEPVIRNEKYSLLSVKLITGRTHQIRAHLNSIGHPILGDGKYGNRIENEMARKKYGLKHQLLHSYKTIFPLLEDQNDLSGKEIIAPLPDYFITIKEDLCHHGILED